MSGPATVTQGAAPRAVMHCTGCEHHRAVKSVFAEVAGLTLREWVCAHAAAWPASSDVRVQAVRAQERAIDGGRYIGKTDMCPEWCPMRGRTGA